MTQKVIPHRTCAHQTYRLSCERFDELRQRVAYRCEVCGTPEQNQPGRTLYVDHDPTVGPWAVRGLLCNRCNSCMDLPVVAGPALDAYLADPWYRRHPEHPIVPTPRPGKADLLLARLDEVTALSKLHGVSAVRPELTEAIVAALKGGATPSGVTKHSPFSVAHVRTLARIAGLSPAARGRRKSGDSKEAGADQ